MAVSADAIPTAVARRFATAGPAVHVVPHGSGHINTSFRVACTAPGGAGRGAQYLLQRLNTGIFKDPAALMRNVERVTRHIAGALAGRQDADRRVLTLVPTPDGQLWLRDADGGCWRMFRFIERSHSLDTIGNTAEAFHAAAAFGEFQRLLADLPEPRLQETIPAFHDTPRRCRALWQAVEADVVGRAAACAGEIAFLRERESLSSLLLDARLPERVTHNDTKLNNVLFDDDTGQALCVVDLDTVMPGLSLYDFGDMVRTATSPTAEDEPDPSLVDMRMPFFRALVEGYLSTAGGFLLPDEKRLLPAAGLLIAYEQAVRFLNDFLRGDVYYRVSRPEDNLYRCRTQMALVQSMEQQMTAMQAVVEAATAEQPAQQAFATKVI